MTIGARTPCSVPAAAGPAVPAGAGGRAVLAGWVGPGDRAGLTGRAGRTCWTALTERAELTKRAELTERAEFAGWTVRMVAPPVSTTSTPNDNILPTTRAHPHFSTRGGHTGTNTPTRSGPTANAGATGHGPAMIEPVLSPVGDHRIPCPVAPRPAGQR
ncbi:hypothetical protein GCM10023075_14020 [Streptosporangium album]